MLPLWLSRFISSHFLRFRASSDARGLQNKVREEVIIMEWDLPFLFKHLNNADFYCLLAERSVIHRSRFRTNESLPKRTLYQSNALRQGLVEDMTLYQTVNQRHLKAFSSQYIGKSTFSFRVIFPSNFNIWTRKTHRPFTLLNTFTTRPHTGKSSINSHATHPLPSNRFSPLYHDRRRTRWFSRTLSRHQTRREMGSPHPRRELQERRWKNAEKLASVE